MADLKFKTIQDNGKEYLGLEQAQGDVNVYMCTLHRYGRAAKAIPSGKELMQQGRWFDLIRDFEPLLFDKNADRVFLDGSLVTIKAQGSGFSLGDRADIGNGEIEQQLRFDNWQIYLFKPRIPGKNADHPGLWEKIEIIQSPILSAVSRPPGYGP
jgi:hypothetical protein